jgi:hypothetical protein
VEVCVGERKARREKFYVETEATMRHIVGRWLEDAFTEMVEESQYDGGGHEVELAFRREVGSFWRIDWSEIGEHYVVMMDEYEGANV